MYPGHNVTLRSAHPSAAAAAIGSAVDRPTCSWVLALALADELAAPCTLRVAIAIAALQLPCASLEGSMAPLRCGERTMASGAPCGCSAGGRRQAAGAQLVLSMRARTACSVYGAHGVRIIGPGTSHYRHHVPDI